MLAAKNHRYKTNTALAALTSLCVIGAVAALSAPYWVSSISILAPFRMSVLATVTVTLIGSATYSIMKNNEISELKAPRIVIGSYQRYLMLQVTDKELKFIEKNYKNENGEYTIDFTNSKGEVFKAESYGQIKYTDNPYPILLGNTKLLDLHQLHKKNDDGIFEEINCEQELETLGLGTEENDAKEVIIRFVPSSIVKSPAITPKEKGNELVSSV